MSIRFTGGFAVLGAFALFVGCKKGENAADTTKVDTSAGAVAPAPTPPPPPALTDPNIAAMVDAANMADSAGGKLASTKGTSADVKDFGRQMMRDHHMLRQKGLALVKKDSITPQMPPGDTLEASAKRMMDNMTAMPKGAAWDKAYIDNEVAVHQSVLNLLQTAQNSATNADLKALITEAIPAVQGHLTKAQSIQSKLASAPASTPAAGDTTKKGTKKSDTTTKKP
jgi:putative membrane protein